MVQRQQRSHQGEGDLFERAAADAFGSAGRHPFVAGNTRTAFASAVCLGFNGHRLTASAADAVGQTLGLAAGAPDDAGYAAWLRGNPHLP